ncbi:MAG: hypothetical protein ACRDVM_09930 [Acidimicrobiia bacterium]
MYPRAVVFIRWADGSNEQKCSELTLEGTGQRVTAQYVSYEWPGAGTADNVTEPERYPIYTAAGRSVPSGRSPPPLDVYHLFVRVAAG